MLKKNLLLLLVLFFMLTGCRYDVEEKLYPSVMCSTPNVTFSVTINTLLNNYDCIGCHNSALSSGNISLVGFTNVKAKVTDGKLLGAINHQPGFSAMPQGRPKMSNCDLKRVKSLD